MLKTEENISTHSGTVVNVKSVYVMQALAGQRITEEAALDWLCLHLDPKDLPRRFAGVSHLRNGAGPVRLVAKADPNAAARRCACLVLEVHPNREMQS